MASEALGLLPGAAVIRDPVSLDELKTRPPAGFLLVIPKQTGPVLNWSDHETMFEMR
jgi:hypothetical protein